MARSYPDQNLMTILCDGYTGRNVTKVLMFHHGNKDLAGAPMGALYAATITAVKAAGWMVISSDAHSTGSADSTWGNDTAQADYLALYTYLSQIVTVSKLVHYGVSMGSLTALLMMANNTVPAVGYIGINPVCSLADMYTNQAWTQAEINAAYGISGDYAAKTTGHDPALLAASLFAGKRLRFYASASDTVVRKSANSDAMSTLVMGQAAECEVVACSGNHGDPSHFQPDDIVSFLSRC